MKYLRHRNQPAAPEQAPGGPGRRSFLWQAGLAAVVAGGLETMGIPQAMAGTTAKQPAAAPAHRAMVPPTRNMGPVYPHPGRPGSQTTAQPGNHITWYSTPGRCGSGSAGSGYFYWYDASNGHYGGPVCA